VIFVDSNVPMYLVGTTHPNKDRARELLEGLIAARERLVTDAEVLQELLHRYAAIRRLDAIAPAFDLVTSVADEVFPIERADVERAHRLLVVSPRLSARDALHLAVMGRYGVERLLSFDAGFDGIVGVVRLS
jgi:hypothetical protein